jgi:CheY-like chemotaxis protein
MMKKLCAICTWSVLSSAGYEVIAVADGALAWDAIQIQYFDLMITDNSMPKVDQQTDCRQY